MGFASQRKPGLIEEEKCTVYNRDEWDSNAMSCFECEAAGRTCRTLEHRHQSDSSTCGRVFTILEDCILRS